LNAPAATLDRVRVFTPFGVRFVDAALDAPVGDGLLVTARAESQPGSAITAFRTPSGHYAFSGIPGLHGVEYPQHDDDPMAAPPQRVAIEVQDRRGRFLGALFLVDLPHRGLYPSASGPLAGLYLFSAPTRPPMPALAAVRAAIETAAGDAAAFAVLELELPGGAVHYGVADARGALLLQCPWPRFDMPPQRSLPAPVDEQHWAVRVRVRHQPAAWRFAPGSNLPTLGSLFAQAFAEILPAAPGSLVVTVMERDEILVHGQELVLRSGDRLPLIVFSAAAPPSIP